MSIIFYGLIDNLLYIITDYKEDADFTEEQETAKDVKSCQRIRTTDFTDWVMKG